jgi:hypothetical protein
VTKTTLAPAFGTPTLGFDPIINDNIWIETTAKVNTIPIDFNSHWLYASNLSTNDNNYLATSTTLNNKVRIFNGSVPALPNSGVITDWHKYTVNVNSVAGTSNIYFDGANLYTASGVSTPNPTQFYLFALPRALSANYSGCWEFASMRIYSGDPVGSTVSRLIHTIKVDGTDTTASTITDNYMPGVYDQATPITAGGTGAVTDYQLDNGAPEKIKIMTED